MDYEGNKDCVGHQVNKENEELRVSQVHLVLMDNAESEDLQDPQVQRVLLVPLGNQVHRVREDPGVLVDRLAQLENQENRVLKEQKAVEVLLDRVGHLGLLVKWEE